MAQRNSAPQYVGTAEEAKGAVEGLMLDLKVHVDVYRASCVAVC